MKKAYFAISYSHRKLFDKEIESLKILLNKYAIELLVFVDVYNFKSHQEKEMMQTAFKEIDSADLLIVELSTKSIGVGIEIGYAYAKHKPILYLRKKDAEYSTTAAGASNLNIMYSNVLDLIDKMEEQLKILNL